MWLRSGCLVTDLMHSAPGGEGKGGRLLAVQLQAWLFVEVEIKPELMVKAKARSIIIAHAIGSPSSFHLLLGSTFSPQRLSRVAHCRPLNKPGFKLVVWPRPCRAESGGRVGVCRRGRCQSWRPGA